MQEFVEFRQIPAPPYYPIVLVWPVCVELADELGRVFYNVAWTFRFLCNMPT